jgi:hypothetical protein
MGTRKAFLSAAVSAGAILAAPKGVSAQSSSPAPSATPSASPAPVKHSPLARAFAEQMRSFDPELSEKDVNAIADGIQQNLDLGKDVNPKGRALRNSDEPAVIFEVGQ